MAKTSNSSDKFIIRLPEGMRDELRHAADENGRTMNAEIIIRLEQSQELKEKLKDYDSTKAELVSTMQHLSELREIYDTQVSGYKEEYERAKAIFEQSQTSFKQLEASFQHSEHLSKTIIKLYGQYIKRIIDLIESDPKEAISLCDELALSVKNLTGGIFSETYPNVDKDKN